MSVRDYFFFWNTSNYLGGMQVRHGRRFWNEGGAAHWNAAGRQRIGRSAALVRHLELVEGRVRSDGR